LSRQGVDQPRTRSPVPATTGPIDSTDWAEAIDVWPRRIGAGVDLPPAA
jgi:hypothetical protein